MSSVEEGEDDTAVSVDVSCVNTPERSDFLRSRKEGKEKVSGRGERKRERIGM